MGAENEELELTQEEQELATALENEGKEDANDKTEKPAQPKEEGSQDGAEGKKGEQGAEKPKEKKEAAAAGDDPEIDFGEKIGKVKLSEARKRMMLQEDYSAKMTEIKEKEKQLETIIEFSEYLKQNPKKAQKIAAILDEIEDAQETGTKKEVKQTVQDAKDEIEEVLEQMDTTDPGAAVLKALYKKLSSLTETVNGFKEREEKLTQQQQEQQQQEQYAKLVDEGKKLLNSTIDEVQKETGFETEEEKQLWRKMIFSDLKNNPKKSYEKREDFVEAIKASAEKATKQIKALAEQTLKKYLERKSTPKLPGSGGGGDAQPKEKPKVTNTESLQQSLEDALAEEEANNS